MPERRQTADVVMAMLEAITRRDGPEAGVLAARDLVEVVASFIAVTRGPDEAASHLRSVALLVEKPSR